MPTWGREGSSFVVLLPKHRSCFDAKRRVRDELSTRAVRELLGRLFGVLNLAQIPRSLRAGVYIYFSLSLARTRAFGVPRKVSQFGHPAVFQQKTKDDRERFGIVWKKSFRRSARRDSLEGAIRSVCPTVTAPRRSVSDSFARNARRRRQVSKGPQHETRERVAGCRSRT